MPALWQTAWRGSPACGCLPALLSAPGRHLQTVWFRNTTSPYLSWWSRWKHVILVLHTSFSYNCSVPWPQEQFSQGKLCQGSLDSTATSNPCSASPTGQLNLAEQSQSLLLCITEKNHLLSTGNPWVLIFLLFFPAKLLSYHLQDHPWFPSVGCGVLTPYVTSTVQIPVSLLFILRTSPLSLCLNGTLHYILVLSKKAASWGEMIWISSLQNSLKRDWLVLRTLNSLIKNAAG